jgi:hypothetical protein
MKSGDLITVKIESYYLRPSLLIHKSNLSLCLLPPQNSRLFGNITPIEKIIEILKVFIFLQTYHHY